MSPKLRLAAFGALAALLVGCMSETPVSPTQRRIAPTGAARLDQSQMDVNGYIYACKDAGPAGTYYFHMDVTGGGALVNVFGPDASVVFDGTNLSCALMAYVDDPSQWGPGVTATVKMTEVQIPVGTQVDSVIIYNSTTGIFEHHSTQPVNPASHSFTYGQRLWFKFFNSLTPVPPGYVRACKVSGPAGTYTFHADVVGGGTFSLPNGSDAAVSFNGTTPACVTMYTPTGTWLTGQTATVQISEVNIPSGLQVQSITVTLNGTTGSPITNTSSTTVTVGYTDIASVGFANALKPPPSGNQGCTPGYWKVKQHFDSWVGTGYTTGQLLSTVFTIPATYTLNNKAMANYSMLDALSFQGGNTASGKAQILLRAAVAGLLNAGNSNVAYALTKAQIVSQVNAALASGNLTTITDLGSLIDGYNNGLGGCPLN